jgi:DHA1 family inner membrane transport protein
MTPALLSLFLAAFAIGTTEFVVAGLLPDISRDLSVSIPEAGLLVTGYAVGVAVGGPILSLLTSRYPRKPMVLVLMGVFVAGHVLCALAPNYAVLMAARIVISATHGTFFGIAGIIAVSIVPENRRASALALLLAGITVANLLGVPGGTAIGHLWGWRTTFWIIGGLAVLAALAMAVLLPGTGAGQHTRSAIAEQFRVLRLRQIWQSYVIIVLWMVGFWTFFTYIAPYLTGVTGFREDQVALLLLVFGVGATAGIFAGGRLADWKPGPTLLGVFPAQAASMILLLLFAASTGAVTVLIFLVGFLCFAPSTTLQSRILRHAADAPELASTLISSVFNIGIAAGALAGAALLSRGVAYAQLPVASLVLAVVTSLFAIHTVRLDRREAAAKIGAAG